MIVDNRNTSILKDYYKVIGSRYKYTLEDFMKKREIERQADEKTINLKKFAGFKDKLSSLFIEARNSGHQSYNLYT